MRVKYKIFLILSPKIAKKELKNFAKKYQQKSIIFRHFPTSAEKKDDNRRELIYKGYIVPYFINNDEILLLGIYKENLWEF